MQNIDHILRAIDSIILIINYTNGIISQTQPALLPINIKLPTYIKPKFPPPTIGNVSNLIKWINSKLDKHPYNIKITNLTKSWKNGIAFCAFADALTPNKMYAKCNTLTENQRIIEAMRSFEKDNVYMHADDDDDFILFPEDDKTMRMQLSAIYDRYK